MEYLDGLVAAVYGFRGPIYDPDSSAINNVIFQHVIHRFTSFVEISSRSLCVSLAEVTAQGVFLTVLFINEDMKGNDRIVPCEK